MQRDCRETALRLIETHADTTSHSIDHFGLIIDHHESMSV
jgi:hypothetical protein